MIKNRIVQTLIDNIEAVRTLPPYEHTPKSSNPLLPISTNSIKKMTLVLDLDETLVHCSLTPFPGYTEIVELSTSNGDSSPSHSIKIYVSYRPYLFEFLEYCSQHFEIVLFTAGDQQYADSILMRIDPQNRYFTHRLYRQHCVPVTTSTQAQLYVKDLSALGRNLSHTLIIDNSITAFGFHLDSGIPIPSFYGQANDSEFFGVLNILDAILRFSSLPECREAAFDVRNNLKEIFNIESQVFPKLPREVAGQVIQTE
ncbi:hypothetical protein FGO68_gene4264 [Halteria grandinella]|uniref:FCP1 homology domain-containing protein n=1 Tax=Halteria grandinella TaxID=5974 RepID=A0A8J8NZP5_HALGN|nr:hypothetical protein FGO68_gene4264 [Halteria grandinella]